MKLRTTIIGGSLAFALVSSAHSSMTLIDFTAFPVGTVITSQFEPQGVIFGGPAFVGGVFYGDGRSFTGLASYSGIAAFFTRPVDQLSFEVHANRIGSEATVYTFLSNGGVRTDYFNAANQCSQPIRT